MVVRSMFLRKLWEQNPRSMYLRKDLDFKTLFILLRGSVVLGNEDTRILGLAV